MSQKNLLRSLASAAALLAMLSVSTAVPVAELGNLQGSFFDLDGQDCNITGPSPICEAQAANYASAFAGSNYAWSFTSNTAGAFFCGPTNLQNVCVNTTQAGGFTLRLDYVLPSGPKNCDLPVVVDPALQISALAPVEACIGDDVAFTTSVLAGNGPHTYAWTVDTGAGPQPIVGANTAVLLLDDVDAGDAGTYCVTVTGQCGPQQSCAELTVEKCGGGETNCTLTQGAYGTAGGFFNGLSTLELLDQLLATDLVLGKPGRSLTIQAGNSACVMARLPANSGATTLPDFGDAVLDSTTCQTSPIALPLKVGRFKNILLGQTLTLALNTRLDGTLSNVGVCESMTTQLMDAGPDGLHGTADDLPDPGPDGIFGTSDDQLTVYISSDVIDELAAQGLPITVGGILELANRALAAQATGEASLSEISGAADAINRGFDECRSLIDCSSGK